MADPKAGASNGVERGDEVYFHTRAGKLTRGAVTHCGKHGFIAKAQDGIHRVLHEGYVGHHKRAERRAEIVEEGEDGVLAKVNGRHVFIRHGKEEDDVMAKSLLPPGTVALFFKAEGDVKGKPGLMLREGTDKRGKKMKHWVLIQKPQAHQRPPAKQEPAPTERKYGSPDTSHRRPGHEKPNYPKRAEGEADKAYAKRIDKEVAHPTHLPEEHDKYFHMGGADTKVVPIDKLVSSKSDEENEKGGNNSPKRMLAAYHGVLGKRDPITVTPEGDKFRIVDGNGTYTGVKKHGWKSLPVKVVSAEVAEKIQREDKLNDAAKASNKERVKFSVGKVVNGKALQDEGKLGGALEQFREHQTDWSRDRMIQSASSSQSAGTASSSSATRASRPTPRSTRRSATVRRRPAPAVTRSAA